MEIPPKLNYMKKTITFLIPLIFASITFTAFGETSKKAAVVNEKCPIKGKAVNPKCTYAFEDVTYAFCCGDCRGEFKEKVTTSLYSQIGGKAAINAAVDLFYTKVLADDRVNYFFEDVNMKRQHNKQKEFLSAALGSPVPYKGMDMRKGHAHMELTEEHFGAIAEHLLATLKELKVKPELIDKVMAVVASTKDDVLNKKKS